MKVKIAFSGMPGAGKSNLAGRVREALGDEHKPVVIIDSDEYAEDVQDRLDLVKGFDGGGYLFNIGVALERIGRERTQEDAKTVITCGTLLDTSVYQAMEFESSNQFQNDEEKQDSARRIEATLKTLACFYMDTFRYDHLFYLPPLEAPQDPQWQTYDRNLQIAFNAFFLTPVIPLIVDPGTPDEMTAQRAEQVIAVLNGEETLESLAERSRATASQTD